MNYIGSKYSLMDFLTTTIADVAGSKAHGKVFADLFAGTGVVGKTFKEKGYRVFEQVRKKWTIEKTDLLW